MTRDSKLKSVWVLFLLCMMAACKESQDELGTQPPAAVNVHGTWIGRVHVDSCQPAAVCKDAAVTSEGFVGATMILSQTAGTIKGKYLYGKDVSVEVQGLAVNPLILTGTGPHNRGSIEVRLSADVNQIRILANVAHKLSLRDGQTVLVGGTGDFRK